MKRRVLLAIGTGFFFGLIIQIIEEWFPSRPIAEVPMISSGAEG